MYVCMYVCIAKFHPDFAGGLTARNAYHENTALIQGSAFCLKLGRAEQVSLHDLHTLGCSTVRFCDSRSVG